MGGFLRSYGLTLLLIAAVAFLWFDNRGLRAELKNSLVSKDLIESALRAKGQDITVNVPGPSGGPAVPVNIRVERPLTPSVAPSSSQPSAPASPRLVADAPSVFCRTEAECKRILAAAPQTVTAEAEIRTGTLATVCLDPLAADQSCPEGRQANLPLAKPIKFTASFVLLEKGVFSGLNIQGSPVVITRVKTETVFVERVQAPSLLYHLGLEAGFVGSQAFTGVTYQNWGPGGTIYRVAAGWGFPGFTGGLFVTLPLR